MEVLQHAVRIQMTPTDQWTVLYLDYWGYQCGCRSPLTQSMQSDSIEILNSSSLKSSKKPCFSLGGWYSVTNRVEDTDLKKTYSKVEKFPKEILLELKWWCFYHFFVTSVIQPGPSERNTIKSAVYILLTMTVVLDKDLTFSSDGARRS